MSTTVTLWRPTGKTELDLVAQSGWKKWPPRLPEQPIFYPVLNRQYATRIAREWNVPDKGVGYVTCFDVQKSFLDRYQAQKVGGKDILEYWIPAEELEALNTNIVGGIREITEYRGPVPASEFEAAELALGRALPSAWREYLQRPSWLRSGWLSDDCFIRLNTLSESISLAEIWEPSTARHPGILFIGSDGAGEHLAVDVRAANPPVMAVINILVPPVGPHKLDRAAGPSLLAGDAATWMQFKCMGLESMRGTFRGRVLIQLAWLLAFCPLSLTQAKRPQDVSFEEKRLGSLPEGAEFIFYVRGFSPDGRTVAFGAKIAGRETVFVGDKKGEDFDKVWHLSWSPNGGLLTYRAERGDRDYAVIGGKVSEPFETVDDPDPSPDGKTFAYAAKLNGRRFIVHGDKRGPEYGYAGYPTFSLDGSSVAYKARDGRRAFVVHQDKEGTAYDDLLDRPLVFSPDGRLCYGAKRAGKYFYVMGGVEGEAFDTVGNLVFSPDGKSYAYAAQVGKQWCLFKDGVRGPLFDSVWYLKYSPDGKTVAYEVREADLTFVMVGDKKDGPFGDLFGITFSPDSKSVAYTGNIGDLIVDGQTRLKGDEIWIKTFSPDCTTVACAVKTGKKWRMIIGDRKGPECDDIYTGTFSADGLRFAYGARIGREFWWKVMDLK